MSKQQRQVFEHDKMLILMTGVIQTPALSKHGMALSKP